MAFVAGSRHVLATLLLLVSASTTAGVAQNSAGDPSLLPLPEVKHVKRPGKGYVEGSPFFKKEQVLEEWKLKAEPKPQEHEDLPTSNTVKCVSVLVTMFFATYGILFSVQTLKRLGFDFDAEERSCSHVAQSLFFTPMLCVLFLAARMRAVQLAKGHSPDSFDLPPWWMRWAEIASVACNVVIAIVSYAGASTLGEDWDDAIKRRGAGRSTGWWLLLARRAALLVLYICFPTVCAGALVMSPPPEVWEAGTEPEVSPALTCTIFLTSLYFGVYLCLAIAKNVNESGLIGEPVRFSKSQRAFYGGAATLSFAPMLCCLFITVRMRALQLDPANGNPEEWVQACFYAASASIGLQSVLSMVAAVIGAANKDSSDISVAPDLHMAPDAKTALVEGLRLLLMGGLYTWVAAILIGLFQMMPPDSPEAQHATMPTSILCVAVLSCLFFGIYLAMWVSSAAEEPDANPVASARDALGFCPMMAVAYMCVTIRSLQLSHGYGAPQDWVQASEIVGTCAIVTLAMSRAASQTTFMSHQLCTVLRYASLLALYCSMAMVLYGFYSMTPDNVAGHVMSSRRSMHHDQSAKHGTLHHDHWQDGDMQAG